MARHVAHVVISLSHNTSSDVLRIATWYQAAHHGTGVQRPAAMPQAAAAASLLTPAHMQPRQGWDLGNASEPPWHSRQPQAAAGSSAPGAKAAEMMTSSRDWALEVSAAVPPPGSGSHEILSVAAGISCFLPFPYA